MRIESTRFGAFDVADGALLRFPRGLAGFPGSTRYALVAHSPEDPFYWLHSADEPAVAFPVTDPWAFHPEYQLEIGDEDLALLETSDPADLAFFGVVAIAPDPAASTINLLAPVVVNLERQLGAQVLNQVEASPHAPLFAGEVAEPRSPAKAGAITLLPGA